MKTKILFYSMLLASCSLLLTGCGGFAGVIKAAGQSGAAVHFTIVAPQGTLTYDRALPEGTNTITVGGNQGITTK